MAVLGMEVYNRLRGKPPIRKPVTMIQVWDGAHLKGFIKGPFNVKEGQSTHQVDLYVAPSRILC